MPIMARCSPANSAELLVARRHQDRRMRLLQRPRPDRHRADTGRTRPPSRTARARSSALRISAIASRSRVARFVGRDVVGDVFVRDAAHQAGDEPPAAHHVEHRVFLGDADRVEQRHEIAEHRELDRLRCAATSARADQVAVRHQPVGAEMVLVAADPVEAAVLGERHGVDVVVVKLLAVLRNEAALLGRPLRRRLLEVGPRHQVEEGEFHRLVFSAVFAALSAIHCSHCRTPR